jgi:hypothetical protein
MANQKDVRAVSPVAVNRDPGWDEVIHEAIEGHDHS